MRTPFKIFLLTIAICFFGACGFHLQQEIRLAPAFHHLYLQAPDPYGQLARSLRDYLHMSKVKLVESKEAANLMLVILRDDTSQELLSVSSSQQTRQYSLRVHVVFEVTDTKGKVIIEPQYLSESRVITVQSNTILGSSNEADLFYQQIRRSLAYMIINRLSSIDITQKINAATKF